MNVPHALSSPGSTGEGISVVLTVLNEAHSIGRVLDDLRKQEQPADEIIIVDGGSTDGTQAIVREGGGRLIDLTGANISQGRNRGIAAAHNDLIAVTDAGVRLKPDWLRLIAAPLRAGTADVVAGFFEPDAHSLFELAMSATVLPALADVDPARFLPSSRSIAFRKKAWRDVGGYPEWLDYCEDLVFDLRLLAAGGVRVVFEPRALVQFRPRANLRTFFRQYYRYARGDGKADLWRKRHIARYSAYAYLLAMLACLLLPRPRRHKRWVSLLTVATTAGAALYLRTPFRRLQALTLGCSQLEWLEMLALLPVIRATGDVAKMAGYPAGRLWRIRHRPGDWRS